MTKQAKKLTHKEWLEAYLKPLVGATITKVEVAPDEYDSDECWPKLHVKTKDVHYTTVLEISRDEEGNGPGFIFGLPHV